MKEEGAGGAAACCAGKPSSPDRSSQNLPQVLHRPALDPPRTVLDQLWLLTSLHLRAVAPELVLQLWSHRAAALQNKWWAWIPRCSIKRTQFRELL